MSAPAQQQQNQQQQQQQQKQQHHHHPIVLPNFGGPDADLAARLQAPVSPTETGTDRAAAEARRCTSDWKPALPGRSFSFDREEHKHAMMTASGTLSGPGPQRSVTEEHGFSERT